MSIKKTPTAFKNIFYAGLLTALVLLSAFSFSAYCEEKWPICAVYLTGIGCSNCAKSDSVILREVLRENPRLVIFEYEIYRHRKENKEVKDAYYAIFLSGQMAGVPFLIVNEKSIAIGRNEVIDSAKKVHRLSSNPFHTPQGVKINFDELDIAQLPGHVVIWTKNRVLLKGKKGNSELLRKLLLCDDIPAALKGVSYRKVLPKPVAISKGELNFENAVRLGDWQLQWNGASVAEKRTNFVSMETSMYLMLLILVVLGMSLSFFRVYKTGKGAPVKLELKARVRDVVIVAISICVLIIFFVLAKNVSSEFLKESGYKMPLFVFTFLIAVIDGFNPCNMFVLTCLLALLISTSDSKRRLYVVAFSFVAMVYVFYFMFMAAWLEAMKYIGFVTPLRITIAIMALGVGVINCKELFFFKKGISLMISEKHKGPLMKRMQGMKEIIQTGSFPLLIFSSLGLAALASLVELPCTAGFPIVYTSILAGKGLNNTFAYYAYLFYYNLVYVLPLLVIIMLFIYTFRARQITQRQMEIIKFIGGIIMILLGIVLLVNPGLIGLGLG